jgi:hypothetical protein
MVAASVIQMVNRTLFLADASKLDSIGLATYLPEGCSISEQKSSEEGMRSFHVTCDVLTLELNLLQRVRPMDRFSKLTLGMNNLLRRFHERDQERAEKAFEIIGDPERIIGIVSPVHEADRSRVDEILLAICADNEGVLFDGNRVLDARGDVVLAAS